MFCKEVLANDGMRTCKLRRDIETKPKNFVHKPVEFFERKRGDLQSQKSIILCYKSIILYYAIMALLTSR